MKNLTLPERQDMLKMRILGKGVREIAKLLNRSPSTVSRELKRQLSNRSKYSYSVLERARLQHEDALRNRGKSRKGFRKLDNGILLEIVVRYLVEDRFSPVQIEQKMKRDYPELSISSKTIYSYIREKREDLIEYLVFKGKSRRSNVCGRRSVFREGAALKRSIHDRGEEVCSREEFGHWEMDTVHGKKSGSKVAILSLIERKTRQSFFFKVKDLSAEQTRRQLVQFIHSQPKGIVKTITADNGSENALWDKVEGVCEGVKFYFCDPYKSQQKGAIERANRELRIFYPKSTDWDNVSTSQLEHNTRIINNKPKKCLGWDCSNEAFGFQLAKAA